MEDFFIVGVGKCGTSSLHRYLGQHPGISVSDPKETNFFLNEVGSYERFFSPSDATIRGEATPEYFHRRYVVDRIRKYNPGSKIIIIIRNPVDRAYSHYRYSVMSFKEERTFGNAIKTDHGNWNDEPDNRNIIRPGMYSEFIPMWTDAFSESRVLILKYEEFFKDPASEIRAVFRFLGVPDHDIGVQVAHNTTVELKRGSMYGVAMSRYGRLARRIFPNAVKGRLATMMYNKTAAIPPMPEEDRRFLTDIYAGELEEYYGSGDGRQA